MTLFKKTMVGLTTAAFIAGGSLLAAPAAQALGGGQNTGGKNTVYDVAANASKGSFAFDRNGNDFDILIAAIKVTGLKGALDDPKADLTVFAPTDAVFKATFGGTNEVGTLVRTLKAVNYDLKALKNVLLYHVTSLNTDSSKGLSLAEVQAALAANNNMVTVPMLNGGKTTVTAPPAQINNSKIVATDIFGSNGVIHVIGDSVLLP